MLQLGNDKTFSIEAINQSDKNVYIQKVMLNVVPISRPYIKHAEIMDGEKLVFVMGDKPNKKLFVQQH